MPQEFAVEMVGISKRYGGVHALNGVDLRVPKGTVHALLGENGAGKSTLVKILMGITQPDEGDIILHGKKVSLKDAKTAQNLGVSMIFQEINTVGHMSVADNMFLGREPISPVTRLVNLELMRTETKKYLSALQVDVSPDEKPCRLNVANNQLIEIAKAVSFNANLIIMDEPTSALSDVEAAHLFSIIRQLSKKGVTIIYISHKLEEIYEICDGITVLRDGANTGEAQAKTVVQDHLISMMVGREVKQLFPKEDAVISGNILEIKGLSRQGEFSDVNFSVRRGEILGIAGLMGSGRSEIAETIFGLRRADSGEIWFKDQLLCAKTPRDAILAGIHLVPEDRKHVGLMLRLALRDNILISALKKCVRRFLLDSKIESELVSNAMQRLEIKAGSPMHTCASLSGGNQQKVVIAKCLLADPDLLILDEPTRGIDVKTKSQIHSLMSKFAQTGRAVIMISSELPEVLGMSDRILVLSAGRIAGELTRSEASPERIMELAMGKRKIHAKPTH